MTTQIGTEFEIQDPNKALTPRQREVLVWIVEGKENEAIGTLMGITLGTVKFHVMALLRRFDAPNRQLLISRAWKAGLVKASPAKARHLVIALLMLGTLVPGTGEYPITVRAPRVARVRVQARRDCEDHPIVMPTNCDDLRTGDREAA